MTQAHMFTWGTCIIKLQTILSSNIERSPTQVPRAPWIVRHFDCLQERTILQVNQIMRYCEWFSHHDANPLQLSLKDMYQPRLEQTTWSLLPIYSLDCRSSIKIWFFWFRLSLVGSRTYNHWLCSSFEMSQGSLWILQSYSLVDHYPDCPLAIRNSSILTISPHNLDQWHFGGR